MAKKEMSLLERHAQGSEDEERRSKRDKARERLGDTTDQQSFHRFLTLES